jgi:hypothetical protein
MYILPPDGRVTERSATQATSTTAMVNCELMTCSCYLCHNGYRHDVSHVYHTEIDGQFRISRTRENSGRTPASAPAIKSGTGFRARPFFVCGSARE